MWVFTVWCVYNVMLILNCKQNRTLSKKEENCKLSTTKSCANQALKVKLHPRGKIGHRKKHFVPDLCPHIQLSIPSSVLCTGTSTFLGPHSLHFLLIDPQKTLLSRRSFSFSFLQLSCFEWSKIVVQFAFLHIKVLPGKHVHEWNGEKRPITLKYTAGMLVE
jgi:hypothetical protein